MSQLAAPVSPCPWECVSVARSRSPGVLLCPARAAWLMRPLCAASDDITLYIIPHPSPTPLYRGGAFEPLTSFHRLLVSSSDEAASLISIYNCTSLDKDGDKDSNQTFPTLALAAPALCSSMRCGFQNQHKRGC